MNNIDWPIVLSNDNGIRPAGPPNACFYCKSIIGEHHKIDCVTVRKRIKVNLSIDLEINVPHFWNKGRIEFHYNEGTWCGDNVIEMLKAFRKEHQEHCLCDNTKLSFIEDVDTTPIQRPWINLA